MHKDSFRTRDSLLLTVLVLYDLALHGFGKCVGILQWYYLQNLMFAVSVYHRHWMTLNCNSLDGIAVSWFDFRYLYHRRYMHRTIALNVGHHRLVHARWHRNRDNSGHGYRIACNTETTVLCLDHDLSSSFQIINNNHNNSKDKFKKKKQQSFIAFGAAHRWSTKIDCLRRMTFNPTTSTKSFSLLSLVSSFIISVISRHLRGNENINNKSFASKVRRKCFKYNSVFIVLCNEIKKKRRNKPKRKKTTKYTIIKYQQRILYVQSFYSLLSLLK